MRSKLNASRQGRSILWGTERDEMLIRSKSGEVIADTAARVDLEYQDIPGACFAGAEIEGGNLSDANLEGADFSGALLYWTYSYGANCQGANFTGATLRGVTFDNVNLKGANFSRAKIIKDNLGGLTSLEGTDFSGARLNGADPSGVDLRGTVLLNCEFDGQTVFPTDSIRSRRAWCGWTRLRAA